MSIPELGTWESGYMEGSKRIWFFSSDSTSPLPCEPCVVDTEMASPIVVGLYSHVALPRACLPCKYTGFEPLDSRSIRMFLLV